MALSDTGTKVAGYQLDVQIGYLLRQASQRHANIFQHHSVGGLTATQFAVLVRLSEVGECSQNHLGRLTSMDVATIKGVIGRLQRKSLVTLRPDPKDRRRTTIALTGNAVGMMAQLYKVGFDITDETLRPLTPKEREKLVQILRKIC